MTPYFEDGNIRLFNCDVLDGLRAMADESVQCCVTSPPYWKLRDYGIEGQIGLEKTPEDYIEKLVQVFREVNRVLKKDGTLWINIGDTYAKDGMPGGHAEGKPSGKFHGHNPRNGDKVSRKIPPGYKPKDLIGIPWMLAFALRADGWYLRQEIIWHKLNPMPESATDRCTKAHEQIFLLSKSKNYFYDADAIRTAPKDPGDDIRRINQQKVLNKSFPDQNKNGLRPRYKTPDGWDTSKGKGGHGSIHRMGRERGQIRPHKTEEQANGANKRSVWSIATRAYPEAHFSTFPPQLITPCILAGSREGDTVLDTFFGSGVTGEVAREHSRKCDGIEIHPDFCELSMKRFQQRILNFI